MSISEASLLRSIWYPASFTAEENCPLTLKGWLTDGSYYINDTNNDFSVFCQSVEEIHKSLSLDAFKFVLHAVQSVHELERSSGFTELTAWRIIQTYYAAFYSAHAVLRFFGQSFSHLERGHVDFLRDRASTEAGLNPTLQSSYYLITLNPNNRNLDFTKKDESHKDLWKSFLELVKFLSNETLTLRASEARRKSLSQKFDSLSNVLQDRGKLRSGNWLSLVRNDVTYKSKEGCWYPFNRRAPQFTEMLRLVSPWRRCEIDHQDPNTIKNEYERFFVTSFIVIDLALSIALDYLSLIEKEGRRSHNFGRLIRQGAGGLGRAG